MTRIGVISHCAGARGSREEMRDTIELACLAEDLGFESFWIAQHHFGFQRGHSPSPLVLLAAVAERTERIRLGTAVVVASLEDPIRLAEDAATVDALSGGRLELGLGAGADPEAARRFGREHDTRRADLRRTVETMIELIEGGRIVPDERGLRDRIWLGTASRSGMELAARLGAGVLSGRSSSPQGPDDALSARMLDEYTRSAANPRIGLSRPVVCTDDTASARELIEDGVADWVERGIRTGRFSEGYSAADYLDRNHIYHGSAATIADGLRGDACLQFATDLLCHVQPVHLTAAQWGPLLERIARRVRPLLTHREDAVAH
ncbi:LLM class flavin-dependent oxidoreductase [Rhodococcus hoagii]|nr:LLM class flavin-dependent oxidoreductase [Prescottella equi]MBM4528098.1 LLM class flavin-dependent oxidoreductase [Prescottella equi]MBM4546204.1 LLM class flavin-dependent oxidoreductase [Prescottella equi]MBM4572962.1 LLM class flavin-dependent oxidoreductase [Prescottella equi]MBM4606399.1 LLM class flavin-dependent oxidoreductase [Prescottella equi]